MKRFFYILLLVSGIAHGQSNDPWRPQLNDLGMSIHPGTDRTDTSFVVMPNGRSYFKKAFRPYFVNTSTQNALTGILTGNILFNSDTNTVSYFDGTNWQYLATRSYARTQGGGGGGGGDFSSSVSTSVDGEFLVFDGTTGKLGKRFTGSGVMLSTSGVGSTTTLSSGISNVISDEVGSGGALVFNLSPTFSTSIIAPLVHGSTSASGNLTLSSTSNGAKGSILFGTSSYNEATNVLTVGGNILVTTGSSFDIGTTANRIRQLYANGININTSVARADNTINVIPTFTITNGTTPAATGTNNIFTESSAASAATSGTTTFKHFGPAGFAPTSGTAIFNFMRLQHTINQTGGANGVTTSFLIDPTITAAANYFAIRTTQGKIQFNGLADVTTPDSLIAYEDGELEKVAATTLRNNVYLNDGTLAGNRIVSGGGNTFSLTGASSILLGASSDITLSGTLNIFPLTTVSDADYVVGTGASIIVLIEITANRTIALPTASSGKFFIIWNQNSSGNSWSFGGGGATVVDAAGGSITTLTNDSVYMILGTGTTFVRIN